MQKDCDSTSLISGQHVDFEKIHTEGITKITTEDMKYAKKLNMAIKLLASSKRVGDTFSVLVAPMLLSEEHPLCNVNDVFNAVFVRGNMLEMQCSTEVEQVNFRQQVPLLQTW